jgi:cell division protein FtsL
MVQLVVAFLRQHWPVLVVYQPVHMVVNLLVILLLVCMMVWAVVVVVQIRHVATILMEDRVQLKLLQRTV